MTRGEQDQLARIIAAGEAILEYSKGGKSRFLENDMVRAAVERQFGILGRAAAKVPGETQSALPGVPWRSLVALSNLLERATEPMDPEKLWLAVGGPLRETLAALRSSAQEPRT
ncbi:MAG TPA: HepT-like ribonuclease domain-containing protein [Candidatus Thermoplasmatota archaeon]|nr:HepT-like ribonuclease domain-containing protein [Candidatus Thermoplasmatota archaeon]